MKTLKESVIEGMIFWGGAVGVMRLLFRYKQMADPLTEFVSNVVVNFGTSILGGALFGATMHYLIKPTLPPK